eukprot:TRINITY_DN18968_c0_g1_i1.p1 TRINITY_DN18968_c0_g1~~TRINITY_DN18968_c0_g1_i1.p1  ORF type:complete len:527 (-),score=145.68 TRINITY_DN18968_c0_g1_i1:67-1647(-)
MVVLSASIITKAGKPLLSRQFVEISRVRIEGLVAAFPKLVGGEKQHTFIETDSVRYVYQPLETLFAVLITTKQSNILEDLDTLHLITKLIPEYCNGVSEEDVAKHAFELVFALDEVITAGYKEKVSAQTIKQYTDMDSHEERVQEMVEKNKQRDAKLLAKKKQKEIEEARRDRERAHGGSGFTGIGSHSSMGGGSSIGFGGVGSSTGGSPTSSASSSFHSAPAPAPKPAASGIKGMQLKKSTKEKDILQSLKDEGELEEAPVVRGGAAASTSSAAVSAQLSAVETVHFIIEEKIVVSVNHDGGVEQMEVKGDLSLKISDSSRAKCKIRLRMGENGGYQFKTHPNVNKTAFTDSAMIQLKETSRAFPVSTPLGVLKWRFVSTSEDDVPFVINCWPSGGTDGSVTCNIDYELKPSHVVLHNVVITIPLPGAGSVAPVIENAVGNYRYDSRAQQLLWLIDLVDSSSPSGSMEFRVASVAESDFFPVTVAFTSPTTLCDIAVDEVVAVESSENFKFSVHSSLAPEQYTIV